LFGGGRSKRQKRGKKGKRNDRWLKGPMFFCEKITRGPPKEAVVGKKQLVDRNPWSVYQRYVRR